MAFQWEISHNIIPSSAKYTAVTQELLASSYCKHTELLGALLTQHKHVYISIHTIYTLYTVCVCVYIYYIYTHKIIYNYIKMYIIIYTYNYTLIIHAYNYTLIIYT